MGTLSVVHWLIALVVAVLLFGPKVIAGFAKGVGQSIRSFKQGMAEDQPDEQPNTSWSVQQQRPQP